MKRSVNLYCVSDVGFFWEGCERKGGFIVRCFAWVKAKRGLSH